ncbi:MAG: hypothetical protein Q8Q29_03965 [Actinomycetota bacterium]|jgi:hypothetical protein|nr:hypothetical protein [Actinomycetota bacterium]
MDAVDVVIAIAIGVSIMALGRWGVKLLATPAPAEPDPDDIVDVERPFRCSVCGMRLTVTHAQGEDVAAPRHCREEMEAV